MNGSEQKDWAAQAAAEGAAVSADPGESGGAIDAGDPSVETPAPDERTFDSPDSDPAPGEPATPSNHLGTGGDPVEGKD